MVSRHGGRHEAGAESGGEDEEPELTSEGCESVTRSVPGPRSTSKRLMWWVRDDAAASLGGPQVFTGAGSPVRSASAKPLELTATRSARRCLLGLDAAG